MLDEGTLHFWAWSCSACSDWFVPQLKLLEWPPGCTPDQALAQARVACPHCGNLHLDREKPKLNATGRYIRHRKLPETERVPGAVFDQYVPDLEPAERKTASFWISGLASPWASFGQVAKVLVEAYRSNEQERIQAEINTWGGELYRVRGDAPAWEEVSACRLEYLPRTVPDGVQKITMGVDVQKNGLFYVIQGWGFNSESWLLDHDFIAGETEHEAVWAGLRSIITGALGQRRIDRCFIDSGYRPGDVQRRPDHAVYSFCRSLPGQVFPTKGQDTMDTPVRFVSLDFTVGGRVIKQGVKLFHLNTDYFKRWLHGRIRWPKDQPGGWHLHVQTTEDFCRQIVSEELLLKASGRSTWIRKSRNNHYLDACVNATAAAHSLNVHTLQRVTAAAVAPPPRQPQSNRYERRTL